MATALAAAGTVSAFFVGLRLYRREAARDQKQREREEQQRERERRSQARLVHGYATMRERPRPEGVITRQWSPLFVIINGSDQPIYQVTLIRQDSQPSTEFAVIHAGDERTEWMGSSEASQLGVAGNLIVPVPFEFTDSATVRWHRNCRGELCEVLAQTSDPCPPREAE